MRDQICTLVEKSSIILRLVFLFRCEGVSSRFARGFPSLLLHGRIIQAFLRNSLPKSSFPFPPARPIPVPMHRVTVSHGFAWRADADASSYILPLYNHVRNVGDFTGK